MFLERMVTLFPKRNSVGEKTIHVSVHRLLKYFLKVLITKLYLAWHYMIGVDVNKVASF